MKKSLIISIMVILAAIVLGAGIYYFIQRSNAPGGSVNIETDESRYIGDDFSVEQIPGWTVGHMPSTLVSFHNNEERHPDGSPAAKINFKSYGAVTFDMVGGRTLDEIYETTIDMITKFAPSAKVSVTENETINGIPAKLTVVDLSQQGVDFKVLLVTYLADDKYYTLSFNTTAEKWLEYEKEFYAVARSFVDTSSPDAGTVPLTDSASVFTEADMEKGWYWATEAGKKTGTPASWLHRFEGTRSAQWYDPARLDI